MIQVKPPYNDFSPNLQSYVQKLKELVLNERKNKTEALFMVFREEPDQIVQLRLSLFEQKSWVEAEPLLEILPQIAPNLMDLMLEIEFCERIPLFLNRLQNIKHLLLNFPRISILSPTDLTLPSTLTFLELTLGVTALPPSLFQKIPNLKILYMTLPKLESLPDSIGKLQNLTTLGFIDCTVLESLPDTIGCLEYLEKFTLRKSGLVKIPEAIRGWAALEEFKATECPRLKSLPDALGALPALRDVWVADCPSLAALPLSLPDAPKLHDVHVDSCPNLKGAAAFGDRWEKVPCVAIYDCGSEWKGITHVRMP